MYSIINQCEIFTKNIFNKTGKNCLLKDIRKKAAS
jgi:hypothetical protein